MRAIAQLLVEADGVQLRVERERAQPARARLVVQRLHKLRAESASSVLPQHRDAGDVRGVADEIQAAGADGASLKPA